MSLVLLLGVWLAAASPGAQPTERFPKGTARMDFGPPPAGIESWDVAECAGCHPSEARAWERSGHASARADFLFAAAVLQDPPGWCTRCHAPAASSPEERLLPLGAGAEERGVTCAACHAAPGAVAGSKSAAAPHPTRAEPELRESSFCAHCHEFGFDIRRTASGAPVLSLTRMQQDTYGEWLEWRASGANARTCQDCHMPGGDHAFGGIRREEALRRALSVTVLPGAKVIEVRAVGVGHAFPTGDIMRWLSLELADDELFTSPVIVARFGRTLGIRLWPDEPGPGLGVTADDRLPASGEPVRVKVPPPPPGRRWLAWRLVYHLVSERQERHGAIPAAVSRIVLHAGVLDP